MQVLEKFVESVGRCGIGGVVLEIERDAVAAVPVIVTRKAELVGHSLEKGVVSGFHEGVNISCEGRKDTHLT